MIVEKNQFTIMRDGLSKESLFNIKQENVAHIFSILRNQLYSDKILAVVREYSTNAMDAHIEGNVERPFEITLPTPFLSEFIVRDFGAGLSEEEIVDIFASYGESTKRSSNSFTGMLGLGSKSAFAYTNTFLIKSRHNGIQYTYSAFIDETNVGAISLIHSEPTEESGLSVHINVKPQDCRAFEDRCISFFKNCTMTPKFINGNRVEEELKKAQEENVLISGSDWKITSSYNRMIINMGNVPYVLDNQTINEFFNNKEKEIIAPFRGYAGYFNGCWTIFAPIGSVKPSASRESLEFDDKTKRYIASKIASICEEIRNRVLSELKNKKSDWQKRVYAHGICKLLNYDIPEIKQYINPLTEKHLAPLGIRKVRYERHQGKFTDDVSVHLRPEANMILFLDSPEVTRVSVRPRVSSYCTQNSIVSRPYDYNNKEAKNLNIICFSTDEDKEKFKKNKDFKGAVMVDLMDVSYSPSKKTNNNTLKGDVGELFVFHPNELYNLKKWKATEERPEKIVWVEISNFMPKGYSKENKILNDILVSLETDFMNLSEKVTLYGVKSAQIGNVGEDWIELTDFYKAKVEEFKVKYKFEYDVYCRMHKLSTFWSCFIFGMDRHYGMGGYRKNHFNPKDVIVPDYMYEPFKSLYIEYALYEHCVSKMNSIQSLCNVLQHKFYEEQELEEIKKLISDIPILGVFQYASVPFEDLHKKISELL
jgi:hypothetical protein